MLNEKQCAILSELIEVNYEYKTAKDYYMPKFHKLQQQVDKLHKKLKKEMGDAEYYNFMIKITRL